MQALKRFCFTYIHILKLAWRVHAKLLILVTISSALWGLTNLPVLYINKSLIDLVINNVGAVDYIPVLRTLILLIIFRTAVEFLRTFLSRLQNHASSVLASLLSDRITVILGEKLSTLDVATVESATFQDKYSKIERQSHQRIWGMLSSLTDFPNSITTIISGIVPLLQFNPLITLIVMIISLPDFFVNSKLSKLEYEDRELKNRHYRVLGWLSWFVTDVNQFQENKIVGNIKHITKKVIGIQDEIFKNDVAMRKRRIKWRTISDIPGWFMSICLNIYFFALAIIGKISLGSAQLLYQSSQTFHNGVGGLLNNVSNIYDNYLFVKDYTWFMALAPDQDEQGLIFAAKLTNGIVFENVWFKYPNSDNWVLKDISFQILPNENIAIVGENGAGKSTLLKLLLGLYPVTKGKITIDGKDLSTYSRKSYWQHVSILRQDFNLYPFSARESIAYTNLNEQDNLAKIKSSAQMANIDEYLSNLPKGYDTPLSKGLDGEEPSGGQKQRIAIARTLFKDSQIMVLDEPTSNVDPKAEEDIFGQIIELTKNQILILVSHRFSTVRKANKILVIENGKLIEEGDHSQLMSRKGLYHELFSLQAKSYK